MKPSIVCLVLLSFYGAQGQMYGGNWMGNLFQNIERMNSDIQSNVMSMNQQLQQNLGSNLNQMTSNLQRSAVEGNIGAPGINFGINAGSITVSAIPGTTKTVESGYTVDGQYYYRETQERIEGNTLYHTDKISIPALGTSNEFHYTLDLTNSAARPVIQPN